MLINEVINKLKDTKYLQSYQSYQLPGPSFFLQSVIRKIKLIQSAPNSRHIIFCWSGPPRGHSSKLRISTVTRRRRYYCPASFLSITWWHNTIHQSTLRVLYVYFPSISSQHSRLTTETYIVIPIFSSVGNCYTPCTIYRKRRIRFNSP